MKSVELLSNIWRLTLICATLTAVAGCGPSAAEDAAFQNYCKTSIQLMDEVNKVTSSEGFTKAKPELDALHSQTQVLYKELMAIPLDTRKKLYESHKDLFLEARNKKFDQLKKMMMGNTFVSKYALDFEIVE